jgi:hypothetical protein
MKIERQSEGDPDRSTRGENFERIPHTTKAKR